MILKGTSWQVELHIDRKSAYIVDGHFGQAKLAQSDIFRLRMKNIENGEVRYLGSQEDFSVLEAEQSDGRVVLTFSSCEDCADVTVYVFAIYDDRGISWSCSIQNQNPVWSAMELTYPMPLITAEGMNLFLPAESGQVVENAGDKSVFDLYVEEKLIGYPSRKCCMQYFAVYGKESGVYLGIHDGSAAAKEIGITHEGGNLGIDVRFFGIGASLPANSFELRGVSRWQYMTGDWFDASMIYRDFVLKEASWLPETGPDGRPDTENCFKDIPMWIMDAMPNTPEQGNNCPKNLTSDLDASTPGYWYERPIRLKKELGVPVSYHIYNWHETPFNLEYPHYHSKQELIDKMETFKQNGLYVMPYINAVAWEMYDSEEGHAVNFDNTGKYGAVLKADGSVRFTRYPQIKKSGKVSHLVPICPCFHTWWDVIDRVSEYMVNDMRVDGVYYDQIAAFTGYPCYSREHGHLPGGGSYWAEEYTAMMLKIRERENHGFCFSECNSESYMKGFDGYLTWTWVCAGEVPAFAAVYAGYIVMLGRSLDGVKKGDVDYFRTNVARSLLSGIQIGWCKSDVVDDLRKLEFLKRIVQLRYQYSVFFRSATMCRPPRVKTSRQPLQMSPALWFKAPIKAEQVQSAAWKSYDGKKVVLFVTCISEQEADCEISFSAREYGVDTDALPNGFLLLGDRVVYKGILAPTECFAVEFLCK